MNPSKLFFRRFPAACLILLLAAGTAVFVLSRRPPPREISSLSAFLDAPVQETAAPFAGDLIAVARPGQYLKAGDTLVRINVLSLVNALEETKKKFQGLYADLPDSYKTLVEAHLRHLEEEPEGKSEQVLKEAGEKEARLRLAQEEANTRLAAVRLAVARQNMILQKSRTARRETTAETQKLQTLQEKERLTKEETQKTQAEYEAAVLARMELKKQISRKEAVVRALQNAPASVRNTLELLDPLLRQAHDLETRIQSAGRFATEPGFTLLLLREEGAKVLANETILYFLPGGDREIRLTARFASDDAQRITAGQPCVVEIGAFNFAGEIRTPLPYAPQGKDTPLPFQIAIPLPLPGPDAFIGFDPRREIRVRLK